MNKEEIKKKTKAVINDQLHQRGYATCVDSLVSMGWLTLNDLNQWKRGKVPYLEKVCHVNLSKLSLFMQIYFAYAKENKYDLRTTYYKKNGTKEKLRFSKSGSDTIEQRYATHIVCMLKKPS